MGVYGSPIARTPNLDRMAAEGVRFDRCYTTNPVCMPARASWFTGQYPSHHGCWQNGVPLPPRADLLPRRLRDAGYHTALIGKIHLDNVWLRKEKHPAYDFDLLTECEGDPYCKDEYFQWLDKQGLYEGYMAQFKKEGHKLGYVRDLPEDKHMNHWIGDHVETYLRERARDKRPFFLSVGFFDPHHPFDPVEPYASMFRPEDMPMPIFDEDEAAFMTPHAAKKRERETFCRDPQKIRGTIAAYHATIAHVDATVGRIMATLQDAGLESDTTVIFTSDHGELLGDHGLIHKGPFFYECSIHVPLLYRFPARFNRRGLVDGDFASHVDLAPTVAALAGVPGPALTQGQPLFDAGLNLRPLPARQAAVVEWREKPFQSQDPFTITRCLRTGRWKYVHYVGADFGELYDLENDPHEFRNLWREASVRSTRDDLRDRLWQSMIENEPCPPRTDIF